MYSFVFFRTFAQWIFKHCFDAMEDDLVVVNHNSLSTSRGRERVARRSRTRSPRKASPPKKLCVRHLSRNVSKEHLNEIFAIYGALKNCDLPSDRNHPHLGRGYGYIEYENVEDAEKVSLELS